MHLPRAAQVRHELGEFGLTYGLVIAAVVVGLLLLALGDVGPIQVATPASPPLGPAF